MYGHYRISIDLNESIAEISMLLSAIKGQEFNQEMTRAACAHYKQLALVCACAFMMSPMALALKDRNKGLQVKNTMAESVTGVYPMFETNKPFWGYQETITVVTELALNFVQTILFFMPDLKNCLGLARMYVFTPTLIGFAEDPHESTLSHMNRIERYRELKRLDNLNNEGRALEPDNQLSFTLWVRTPPTARLLT